MRPKIVHPPFLLSLQYSVTYIVLLKRRVLLYHDMIKDYEKV